MSKVIIIEGIDVVIEIEPRGPYDDDVVMVYD